jgi:hypothetical protein
MEPNAADCHDLASYLTWDCMQKSPPYQVNKIYSKIMPDIEALEILVNNANLSFAPNLLQVLDLATPPTLDWLKNLPKDSFQVWGVYVIILEKLGSQPQVYVGSGTSALEGIKGRWRNYDVDQSVPSGVRRAKANGYHISSKGLLAWGPIPASVAMPPIRVLFVALEAAFTFAFGAFNDKVTFTLEQASLCLWARKELGYGGLCSHSSLSELPSGNHALTAEEYEDMSATYLERKRISNKRVRDRQKAEDPEAYSARLRARKLKWDEANPGRRREINEECRAKRKEENPDEYAEKARADRAKWVANNPEKAKESSDRCNQRNIDEKRFHCDVCPQSCRSQALLDRHLESKSHLRMVAAAAGIPEKVKPLTPQQRCAQKAIDEKRFYCAICPRTCPTQASLNTHLKTAGHIKKAAEVEGQTASLPSGTKRTAEAAGFDS